MKQNGFTLIEVLLYVGILAMITGLFTGILTVAARFQVNQSASNEVSQQLNFTMQTIQRLVRESSNIEEIGTDNDDTPTNEFSYLKLRMKDVAKDPTCISLIEEDAVNHFGAVRVTSGPATGNAQNCKDSAATENLTTAKVYISTDLPAGLAFQKFSNPPGHDTVQIDLTLNYNTTNPQSQVARTLTTAIGRVSAATFDSSLMPGGSFNIGNISNKWNEIYVQKIKGQFEEPDNYAGIGGANRGYMAIAAFNSVSCTTVCTSHGLDCNTSNLAEKLFTTTFPNNTTCIDTVGRRLCFCQ